MVRGRKDNEAEGYGNKKTRSLSLQITHVKLVASDSGKQCNEIATGSPACVKLNKIKGNKSV